MGKDGKPVCDTVDFRHTLYAGWIATQHPNQMPFLTINRLCEHGIMQQRGLDVFHNSK